MMKNRIALYFGCLFLLTTPMLADPTTSEQSKLLPVWAREKFAPRTKYYEVIRWIDPSLVQGDFNGDGQRDVAVLVRNKLNKKIGIAIVLRGDYPPVILGAGKKFFDGGDDFEWLTGWERVGPAEKAPNNADRLALAGTITCSVVWDGQAFTFGPAVFESGD